MANDLMTEKRIIILGAGFAGVECARTLVHSLPKHEYKVVIFNKENHMVFHPLLAEVVGASVQPKDAAAPIRQLVKNVRCRREDVVRVNLEKKEIEYEGDNGECRALGYDQLIIACGNEANLATVPGMADHALPLKGLGDAIRLQGHIVDQLEKADVCDSDERRRWHLTFIVIGGGFSGVEVAGEINDLIIASHKFYRNLSKDDISVIIVHPASQILPELSPSMRDFAAKKMTQAGVQLHLNRRVTSCTKDGAHLDNGDFLKGATVVCTIGSAPHSLIQSIDVKKERGRLSTEPDMSLPKYPDVWAIGDCAAVINAYDGQLSPPTAQFAERQAKQVSHNVIARLKGLKTLPFRHRPMGMLCAIGGRKAVAEVMGIKISGFPAWVFWRGVYLMKLPSFSQKVKVGVEWFLDLLLPRQLANLRVDRRENIYRLFFQTGDFVFHEGDPAAEFFMIERGTVEVLERVNGEYERVVRLGPGEFFGEAALLNNRAHSRACRALSDVELVVLGSKLFTDISGSLTPLKKALALSVQKNTPIWQKVPELKDILDTVPLENHIELSSESRVNAITLVGNAVQHMNDKRTDILFIVDEEQTLLGVLTKTDLLNCIEIAANLPKEQRLALTLKDIITSEPVAVSTLDSSSHVLATMRTYGFTKLPVVENQSNRKLVGHVRIENILNSVYSHVTSE